MYYTGHKDVTLQEGICTVMKVEMLKYSIWLLFQEDNMEAPLYLINFQFR